MTPRNTFRLRITAQLPMACLLLAGSFAGIAHSQSGSRVAPRIVESVDDSRLLRLDGNVSPLAQLRYDRGEAAPSTQLTHIRLVLARSPQQEAALDKYLFDLQSKSSPNYHKWLTPEQFGRLYGPADSDIAAIVSWIESRGLKLEEVSVGRTNIAFSGTVSQVEEAFHIQIHAFEAQGQHFYANVSDPSIPAALGPVVKGVAHLNTFLPIPMHERGAAGKLDPESKRLVPAPDLQMSGPKPNLTLGSGTANDPYFLYIVPGDAATIYDTPNTTFNANYLSGTTWDGTGVTIGIGGAAAIQGATVADYRTAFLGNSTQPTITNVDGVGANGATDEAYIDTELSGGMAPGATIHFYTSSDLVSAIERMLTDNSVDLFSLSFGECEQNLSTSDNAQLAGWWKQAAAEGITVLVATGDSGSASCDANTDSQGNNVTAAVAGLQVSGYASTPYNLAVGGTDFVGLESSFPDYVSTSQGTSATFFRSAEKYIPESTWNDSTVTNTSISANTPLTGSTNGDPNGNIVGGGGGKSTCSTNTTVDTANGSNPGTCTSGYSKPYWQRGSGVPSDSARDIPDISLMAGNGATPATWLICTDDTGQNSSGVTVTANCTTQSDGSFYFFGFGGTSTAAPSFAGILAIVEQEAGTGRLGQAAVELYDLYNGSHAGAIFHDTTVGNNSVPCTSGTPDCAKDSSGYYYESGYNTTTGFDLATGLGSVDVKELATYWGTGTGPESATLSVDPSETLVAPGTSFTVAAMLSGNSTGGTPTGTVTLSGGGYTSSAENLTGGEYTFTVQANSLASGTDTLTVTYSGDQNYGSTSNSTTVTVNAPVATLSPKSLTFTSTAVGTTAATQSVTLSNTGSASLAISGITVTGTDSSSFTQSNTCGSSVAATVQCTITVTFTPAATGMLTASISIADNATGSPQSISLSGTGAEVGTYALSATTATVSSPGASATSTITATGSGGYEGPNTITLSSCTLASSPAGAIDSPSCTITGATVTFAAGSTSGTGGTVSFSTTAATSNAVKHGLAQTRRPAGLAAAAALAGLLLLGIPARSRKWRALLGVFFLTAILGVVSGCGGGGSSGGGGGNAGTTTGAYTFTVSGTDAGGVTGTATVNLTVN